MAFTTEQGPNSFPIPKNESPVGRISVTMTEQGGHILQENFNGSQDIVTHRQFSTPQPHKDITKQQIKPYYKCYTLMVA